MNVQRTPVASAVALLMVSIAGAAVAQTATKAEDAAQVIEVTGIRGSLQKSLEARQRYLDKVDRTTDPAAWGAAQQEMGRALAALGEREGARDKLEEGVSRLRIAMDALWSTDSLQQAEVALRALQRAEGDSEI